MRRAPWSSAVPRVALGLALLLELVACRAPSPVNAIAAASNSAAQGAASTPASSASAASPAPSSSAEASAPAPRLVDPHAPHPVLLALVRRLSEWSPALASRLATVSLADTAAADPERTQDYLLYLVAQRLLLPTVRLSSDPVLGEVAESIVASTLFGMNSVGTRLSMKQELTPTACYDCHDCTADYRCTLEQKRAAPVFLVADGLGFYNGLCDDDLGFPWFPACELALECYLDATVAAGLSRRRVEDVSFQVVQDVARRCRTIEQPPALDPNHPLEAARILEQAHARWRALYGTSLRSEPLVVTGAVHSVASGADAEAAWRRFECRMYREVPTTRGYARELEAYYAAERAREESDDESSDEPLESPELDCYQRRGPAERSCQQVDSGTNGVRSALSDPLEADPPPAELITQLALALESLSLAGISPRVIDEQYRRLARELTSEAKGR